MARSECRWESPEQWSQWNAWLSAGLHGRSRWRFPVVLLGMLFASGRRTVTTWLRAAGVSDDYQDYYYFLVAVGRKTESVAERLFALLLIVLQGHRRADRLFAAPVRGVDFPATAGM